MTFKGREARVDFNTLPYCFRLACVRWNQHNRHYLTMTRFLLKWLLVSVLMIGTSCTRKASEIPAPEVPKLTLAERAAKGDAAAQCELGVMYAQGKGVPQDGERAEMWLERAADQGYVRAQYNLGYAYLTGTGVEKNPVQAARWFQKAAERGDAKAQATLGGMYAAGEGIEHDPVEAVKWFRKAAEQGDAPAQDRVGTAYAAGNGVDKDYAQAATWFRMAADQGLAQGQKDLGTLYAEGLGVTQDVDEAIKWFRKAADQGDTEAQAKLSKLSVQRQMKEEPAVLEPEKFTKAEWTRKVMAVTQVIDGHILEVGREKLFKAVGAPTSIQSHGSEWYFYWDCSDGQIQLVISVSGEWLYHGTINTY